MITHVAIKYNNRTFSLPAPNRHIDVVQLIFQETGNGINGPYIQGFLDSYGNFLTRQEALEHAKRFNQLTRPNDPAYYQGEKLFSDDLW